VWALLGAGQQDDAGAGVTLMSILTSRELEFLASLNTNWRRLYFTELARLLEEDERRCGADERQQRKPELFEVSTRLPS
jgi:hypothetical protein